MTEQIAVFVSLIILLICDLVVVAGRSSFVHTSYVHLISLRDDHNERANRALSLIQSLPRVRASFNLILVFLRFFIASLVFYLLVKDYQINIFITIGVLLISALLLFWLEWLVEMFIMRSPELWAIRFTSFARIIMVVLSPVLALPMALMGDSRDDLEQPTTVTEDDLRALIDIGQEEGYVEEVERRMIHSIFRLSDTLVREIMVPRIDMTAIDINTTRQEAIDVFIESGYSRLPVYEHNVDNMLGLLYAKDLLRVWREGDDLNSLQDLLRPAYYVPEAKRVDELLEEMQKQRIHIAIVVDEYGGVAGLVTLEDIVEEILGEIQDEYDLREELPYERLEDGDYLFAGRVDLDDFNDIMDSELPVDEADTLGGYIYSRLGRVPVVGEQVQQDDLLLTVEQVSARRIRKVRASRRTQDDNNKDGDKDANQ